MYFPNILPEPLTDDEVSKIIDEVISEVNATDMKDMGKVVGVLKSKISGRADMGQVSKIVREKLT